MGKRYLGVEIGEDGYVVETPDNKRRPKTSPTNGRLSGKRGTSPGGQASHNDRPGIPAEVKFSDAAPPMPLALWRLILS